MKQSRYEEALITEKTSSNAWQYRSREYCKSSWLKAAEKACRFTKKHWWGKGTWCGMWQLTVQSRKSGEVGKPGRMVAARRKIRRLRDSSDMMYILRNPRQNRKSSWTLHPVALDYFANQMRCRNLDVQGGKPVHKDAGALCQDDRAKQAPCKEQWECLSNLVFD